MGEARDPNEVGRTLAHDLVSNADLTAPGITSLRNLYRDRLLPEPGVHNPGMAELQARCNEPISDTPHVQDIGRLALGVQLPPQPAGV